MIIAQNFSISWQNATELIGEPEKLGLAGMVAAKTQDGFLMAGGANFPDALPWEGGKKYFSDKIFFLNNENQLEKLSLKLPNPVAYGGYISIDNQLVILGGETPNGASNKVYLVDKNSVKTLPDLPTSVIAPSVVAIGNKIYLAGGDTASETSTQFLVLETNTKKTEWKKLPDLPFKTANAAIFSANDKIYIAGGRSKNPNGISTLNTEVFAFDLKSNTWNKETDIVINNEKSPFTASAFFAYKNRFLVFAGGDDGKVFHQIETFLSKMASETNPEEKERLTKEKNYLVKHHQGFNNSVLVYDTVEKSWKEMGKLPFTAVVTTATISDGKSVHIFSGEIRPGIRTPKIQHGEILE